MEMLFGRRKRRLNRGRIEWKARSVNYQQSLWKVRLKVICQVNWSRGGLASVNVWLCVCVFVCEHWRLYYFMFVCGCRFMDFSRFSNCNLSAVNNLWKRFSQSANVYLCALMWIYGFFFCFCIRTRAPSNVQEMNTHAIATTTTSKSDGF